MSYKGVSSVLYQQTWEHWRIMQLRDSIRPMAEDNPAMSRSTFSQAESERKTIHKGLSSYQLNSLCFLTHFYFITLYKPHCENHHFLLTFPYKIFRSKAFLRGKNSFSLHRKIYTYVYTHTYMQNNHTENIIYTPV